MTTDNSNEQDIVEEATDDDEVTDDAAKDLTDVIPSYSIVSYGADFDVAGVVTRLQAGEIVIPPFQRGFVWTRRQASRFIESLLMGLPVPGIFLWRDPTTQKFTVVDGQQRLRTLQYFKEGILRGREFILPAETSPYQKMHPRFQKRTYKTLEDEDRRLLDNTIIHATIVNQDRPPGDDSSIFYLFERINTEGTPLAAEEIRSAVYQGKFIALLAELNQLEAWRAVYGAVSPRMKDRELIARFFALYYNVDTYARPMKEFLNQLYGRNRDLEIHSADELTTLFSATIGVVSRALGAKAFRPERSLNAAVYDSAMVGLARRLSAGPINDLGALQRAYDTLLADEDYQELYSRATADAENVRSRIASATAAFKDTP